LFFIMGRTKRHTVILVLRHRDIHRKLLPSTALRKIAARTTGRTISARSARLHSTSRNPPTATPLAGFPGTRGLDDESWTEEAPGLSWPYSVRSRSLRERTHDVYLGHS
jgi:hypothetical protein